MPKLPATPVQRKRRSDAEQNRLRILKAAKAAFARDGAAASLDAIARRAGVGPGTLYRHFPTRDTLIEAVYRSEVEALGAAAKELSEALPPVDALRAWMLLFLDYLAAKHIIVPALNSIAGGPKRLYEGSRSVIQQAMRALVQRAVTAGKIRPEVDADVLLRALLGFPYVPFGGDWQKGARQLVDIIIAGSLR
jgi:AcrR family transcriptional regulator